VIYSKYKRIPWSFPERQSSCRRCMYGGYAYSNKFEMHHTFQQERLRLEILPSPRLLVLLPVRRAHTWTLVRRLSAGLVLL
jgi:hypothetical protein